MMLLSKLSINNIFRVPSYKLNSSKFYIQFAVTCMYIGDTVYILEHNEIFIALLRDG